jgi:hypothetical protein
MSQGAGRGIHDGLKALSRVANVLRRPGERHLERLCGARSGVTSLVVARREPRETKYGPVRRCHVNGTNAQP